METQPTSIYIFQYTLNLIVSTLFMQEPTRKNPKNKINLNSNTVLSLFIFKQPSGSEMKLKFKMRAEKMERKERENSDD